MRLIDADALEEYIDVGHFRSPCELSFSENDVIRIIRKQPTVETVPVVHGHWVKYRYASYKCSVCNRANGHNKSDGYCGYCGAKMDEPVGNSDKMKDGEHDEAD